ncbi:uncharacterized protein LOC123686515 [Harmonia axyridis]|uniref:uncharacterized protein LOC123686515 n=1 Tax=Harmonia axyridis TaxID=115357 RepID=UPI001E277116|nr:uncharacterized protein LOC123686515 [Harmonia axyridis]
MSSFSWNFSVRTSTMLLLISVLCFCTVVTREAVAAPALAKTHQYVKPLPGLIPVYIRPDNTPLEDINPDLAEAFEFYEAKHGRLNFGRSSKSKEDDKIDIAEVNLPEEDNHIAPPKEHKETVINLNDLSLGVPVAIALPEVPESTFIHIQKIPRRHSS